MGRPLTLADGQLGATAATLLSGADAPQSGRVDVVLQNTASADQTVVLTYRLSGGTARRLARFVIGQNRQVLVRGVPLQPDDTILAVSTEAGAVDYLVFASGAGTLSFDCFGEDGTPAGVGVMRRLALGMEVQVGGPLPDPG